MVLDIENEKEIGIEHFRNGEGTIFAKMFNDGKVKIMKSVLPAHTSIGMHAHVTSSEIVYCLKGEATITCDGRKEILKPGQVHYCPKGSTHEIRNDTEEEFVSFNVVPEC